MKTASQFTAFTAVSLASFAVDWSVFSALWRVLPDETRARLFLSVAVARCLSLVFNFACNRFLVFRAGTDLPQNVGTDLPPPKKTGRAFARYLALAAAILAGSWGILKAIHSLLPAFPLAAAKPIVDLALFLLSFFAQKKFVFAK